MDRGVTGLGRPTRVVDGTGRRENMFERLDRASSQSSHAELDEGYPHS